MSSPKFKRHYGLEFEFSTQYENAKDIITKAIKKVYGPYSNMLYSVNKWHRSINNHRWHLKIDSTTGCELCTPVITHTQLPKVLQVISWLNRSSIRVTTRDAFHIHSEITGSTLDQVQLYWLQNESAIVKYFPSYRSAKDGYAIPVLKTIPPSLLGKTIASFYPLARESLRAHHSALSTTFHEDRGTVEFRLPIGTKNSKYVKNWYNFFNAFLDESSGINIIEVLCSKYQRLQELTFMW